jgi:hypothetical protein
MLRSYKFKNFYSFLDETAVSFVMNKHVPDNNLVCNRHDEQRLSKVMAIIGPNASGKTNLIKPLVFLDWFISRSFYSEPDKLIPMRTHFFSESPNAEFEFEFDYKDSLWKYELIVTKHKVIREALFKKTSRLYSYVFERDWNEADSAYKVKQQNFGLSHKEAEKVRDNASLISTAAHFEVNLAQELIKTCVYTNVNAHGREHPGLGQMFDTTDFYSDNPEFLSQMNDLLKKWDLGLADIKIEKRKVTNKNGEEIEQNFPVAVHSCRDKEAKQLLMFESSGTQGAYLILSEILPALANGGVAVIDELEADLHPHMIEPIINLFCDEETNPKNAQIIFTCHTIEVLNLLNKAQVYLVQKSESCASDAWRLDSMRGVRNDDNLYAKYMAGAYGAVPNL